MDDGTVISVYTKHMLGGNSYKNKKWASCVNADQVVAMGEMLPTFLVTSSGDFLALSQTLKTAKLFEEKGIEHKLMNWDKVDGKGLPHVFAVLFPESEPARKTIDEMLAFFKKYAKQEETV